MTNGLNSRTRLGCYFGHEIVFSKYLKKKFDERYLDALIPCIASLLTNLSCRSGEWPTPRIMYHMASTCYENFIILELGMANDLEMHAVTGKVERACDQRLGCISYTSHADWDPSHAQNVLV